MFHLTGKLILRDYFVGGLARSFKILVHEKVPERPFQFATGGGALRGGNQHRFAIQRAQFIELLPINGRQGSRGHHPERSLQMTGARCPFRLARTRKGVISKRAVLASFCELLEEGPGAALQIMQLRIGAPFGIAQHDGGMDPNRELSSQGRVLFEIRFGDSRLVLGVVEDHEDELVSHLISELLMLEDFPFQLPTPGIGRGETEKEILLLFRGQFFGGLEIGLPRKVCQGGRGKEGPSQNIRDQEVHDKISFFERATLGE